MRSNLYTLAPGKSFFESENVLDLRAPPSVDALIVVADDEEVAVYVGEQLDDGILHAVGILKLVHVDIAEAAGQIFRAPPCPFRADAALRSKGHRNRAHCFFLQVLAIGGIHLRDIADALEVRIAFGILLGALPEHFGIGDVELDVFELLFILQPTLRNAFLMMLARSVSL